MRMKNLLEFFLFIFNFLNCEASRGSIAYENETWSFLVMNGKLLPEEDIKYSINAKKVASLRTQKYIEYWGDNHFCAGVLTSRRMVLTAAHCIIDKYKIGLNEARIRVIAGSTERLSQAENSLQVEVSKIVAHPRYKRFKRNDIAILFTKSDIPERDVVKFSSLAKIEPEVGVKCITFGWGQMYPNGPFADEMLYIDVEIAPAENCENFFDDYDPIVQLCAVDVEQLGDVCPGDFGGPLFCDGSLAGIVSGVQVCTGGRPIMFTNVAYFNDWIHRTQISRATILPSSVLSIAFSIVTSIGYVNKKYLNY